MDNVIQLHAYAVYSVRKLGGGSRTIGKLNELLQACAVECAAITTKLDALAAENGTLKAERDTLQSRLSENKPLPMPEAIVVDDKVVVTEESIKEALDAIEVLESNPPPNSSDAS